MVTGGNGEGPLWRLHSDQINRRLIFRWLGDRSGAVLKTDLFDESLTGGLVPTLEALFDRVAGIDVDREVVARAAAENPALDARVADVRALPFAHGGFDAVVSNSTLDHFDGRGPIVDSLREIRRVLRPGGALLISLDNPLNPVIALRNLLPPQLARALRGGFPYPAGWTTGPAGLRALLVDAGLDPMAGTTVCHAPRWLLALSRRPARTSSRRLALALRMEALERLPTRSISGHFVAALAVRPN